MYVLPNFKTKKQLKEAVARGDRVTYFNPGLGETPTTGYFTAEGPHYPAAHTWYAKCAVVDGKIVKVL